MNPINVVIYDEQQHCSSCSVCICVFKDQEISPYPLLYASSSIFALSSALISALISSKFTEGLAGSLSCSVTLFPLHCFRWERTISHGHHYITTLWSCLIMGKLQHWLSGAVHYRHHHGHGESKQKNGAVKFVSAILVFSQNIQLGHLSALTCSLYNQDMIVALCLDFVKLLYKCLDYDPGQHIHQLQQSLIIFHAFRDIFISLGLFLLCKTHPEGHTNKPQVPLQHKMLLIRDD